MSTNQTDDNAESGWTESGRSLLSRGWSIGKNLALAGAAISVVPVLVPPLLVFSVFALALSVPFGVYYAGVVGTERLMGSLLPLGEGQDQDEVRNEDEKDVEERVGVVRDVSEITDEKGERNEDVIKETVKVNQPESQKDQEDKEKSFNTEQEDENISSVQIEGELWRKTVVETVYDVKDGKNEGEEIRTKMVEIKPIKVRSEENRKTTEKTENEAAQNLGLEGKKRKTPDEAKGENGSSGFRLELKSAGDGKSEAESTMTTDREEKQYNKKQLWEQVRALRIVIGYKDPICKNLPDEMRALYHFTGVELPLTATDVTTIMDLNYKLHFLKSVIGVK